MKPSLAAIVLAAGRGTRMRSQCAKVLHEIAGKPMVSHAVQAVAAVKPELLVLVVGHQARDVEKVARQALPDCKLVVSRQDRQLGTAHAAYAGMRILPTEFSGDVLICYGDLPLLKPATLREFLKEHRASSSLVSFISIQSDKGGAYGRVLRNTSGEVEAIVEARDATPAQLAITEVNTGIYLIEAKFLRWALDQVQSNNTQGEYYLTDVIAIARGSGVKVKAWVAPNPAEFIGINSREELAQV